jgi:uncharacterized protein YqeY
MGKYLSRLTADIKDAMKARDRLRLDVLRMVVAGIKEDQHRKATDELSDEDELAVLMRAVKTRKDSVQQAIEVGRQEIADKEQAEIAIIDGYLPTQITGDELAAKVREVAVAIGYSGPKDTGRFMKEWMGRYKGQADGREVQQALKALADG